MTAIGSHHIALRVSNLERSTSFFREVLGTVELTDPLPLDQLSCHRLFAGPPGGSARFSFIGFESWDQPAFELIEFVEPQVPIGPTNTWEDGLMHWCFTDPDVTATLQRVAANGGQQFGETRIMQDADGSELVQAYFRDPDGNLFQLLSEDLEGVIGRLRLRASALATNGTGA